MTDFAEFFEFEPPADRRELDKWLLEQEERIARKTSRLLRRVITESTEAFFNSLTASGDMGAFDPIPIRWAAYVDEFLGDEFGGLYLSGGLTAWIDTGMGERLPEQMSARWIDVVNQNAVAYAEQAKNRMKDVGLNAWNDIKQSVAKSIATGTSTDDLKTILVKNQSFSEYRADAIARTETIGAFNLGNWDGQDALGEFSPPYKYWIATLDDRGRPTHQEQNLVVKLRAEPYTVNGEEMLFPHAPGTSAKNVVNCRCRYGTLYPGEPHPLTGEPMPIPEGWTDPFGEGSGVFNIPRATSGLSRLTPTPSTLLDELKGTVRKGTTEDLPGEWEFLSTLDTEEAAGLVGYTGKSWYVEVNDWLRTLRINPERAGEADSYLQKIIDRIDSAFTKLPSQEPHVVYRGMGFDVNDMGINWADWTEMSFKTQQETVANFFANKFPQGSIVDFGGGYVSSSRKAGVATGFAKGDAKIVFEIEANKGMPIKELSDFKEEHEILFNRDSRFEVVRIESPALFETSSGTKEITTVVLRQVT